jgi:hypothetical protein
MPAAHFFSIAPPMLALAQGHPTRQGFPAEDRS